MQRDKKINLAEVATLAGVSTATVSRVINDYPFIRLETKNRVLKVISETNYRVNAVARNLRRKKTHSIGVIVSNVLSPFYSVIAKSVEDTAIGNGYRTILCNGGDSPEKELNYLKMLHENRVDGVILSPTGKNKEYLSYLLGSGIPVVFVDRVVDGIRCDTVLVNNREASKEAVEYLLDRNYRRIGFISGPKDRLTGIERLGGYTEAVAGHGSAEDPELIRYGDFSYESGRECAAGLIDSGKIDSMYAANIDMATGAFHVLKERGVRVPEKIAFVMFDDPDWATLVTPRVTAVRQPVYAIGSTAAELLLKRIPEGGRYLDKEPLKIVLEAKLIARESA
jgi:DNA-binding LacI/PurR family transcriptional regulator